MLTPERSQVRRNLLKTGAKIALISAISKPWIVSAQSAPIRIGHLTPRSGFLGPLGAYGEKGADLAIDEIDAAGGINGRQVILIKEDSADPDGVKAKVETLISVRKVDFIVGGISSAVCNQIAKISEKAKTVYLNTGGSSDALRTSSFGRYVFHVEPRNEMYALSVARWLLSIGRLKNKKLYWVTADYEFGLANRATAMRFMAENGGVSAVDERVQSDSSDFSSQLLNIREAEPDLVVVNLAGHQLTNFLKQFSEFKLAIPIAGFGFDTVLAWAIGARNFIGTWPVPWHHKVETPASSSFVTSFVRKYGHPPETQAWSDYAGLKTLAHVINDLNTLNSDKISQYLLSGATFDILKERRGFFRVSDRQLMQEMYTISALNRAQVRDDWDIFSVSRPIPDPDENLEVIAPN
jgi:branched-chain amino acid transport system substrate-binding protein